MADRQYLLLARKIEDLGRKLLELAAIVGEPQSRIRALISQKTMPTKPAITNTRTVVRTDNQIITNSC
jgi:hypothetical protein